MHVHRHPVPDRGIRRGGHAQAGVEACDGCVQGRRRHPHAAGNVLLAEVAGEVQRQALARPARLGRAVLGVDAAHAGTQARRRDGHRIADRYPAGKGGAGHHQADALQGEAAVDGVAEAARRGTRGKVIGFGQQMRVEGLDALALRGRHLEQRCAFQRGAGQQRGDFRPRRRAPLGRDGIDLGQRHGTALQIEQVDDGEVLARLRHRSVVGRHHQQHEIDAGRAGQHVVHQPLVAGHVDEAEAPRVGIGVAEVEGDAARLLFLQAVAVHAGQCLDQRGLAVVDVPCRADDHSAVISFELMR